jgi:hypothetical protein
MQALSPCHLRGLGDPVLTLIGRNSVFRPLVRFLTPFITGYSSQRVLDSLGSKGCYCDVAASDMLRQALDLAVGS